MKFKAIVMDVDGTLANNEKEISPKTKETLMRAQEKGILLILASGRPTSGLIKFGKDLKMDVNNGLFISFNGSKVINFQTDEELFNEPMSIKDAKAVLGHLKNFDVIPMIDKDHYMHVNNVYDHIEWRGQDFDVIRYESRGGNYLLCETDDLEDFVDYPLNKILTAGDPPYLQANYQAMMEPFKDSLNCMFTGEFYFEFTAKDIDKAKALDTVLKDLGISSDEVIAFGDGHNDLSIIEYAGTGVAMENAVDDLKEKADEITLSNLDDGIAASLIRHMPELS